MAAYSVTWEEKSPTSSHPSRHSTTVSAENVSEAKAKVKRRIMAGHKVSNMTAVKL